MKRYKVTKQNNMNIIIRDQPAASEQKNQKELSENKTSEYKFSCGES